MIKKRNTHTAEFKAKVALEAVRGMQTVNELAQHYGVHPVQVGQWKRVLLDQAEQVFETKRGPKVKAEAQSEDRLYSEIGRLKMELDWLKKKSGISLG
jgi:transposase-like protein